MRKVMAARQLALMIGLALAIALFASCAATAVPSGPSAAIATIPAADDASIQSDLKARLLEDERIQSGQINLDVKSGVVTLLGWARTDDERKVIEEIARSIPGVREVDNHIQVRPRPISQAARSLMA